MTPNSTPINRAREAIADAKYKESIRILQSFISDNSVNYNLAEYRNRVLINSNQFSEIRKLLILTIISPEQYLASTAKTTNSLLNLIDAMEAEIENPNMDNNLYPDLSWLAYPDVPVNYDYAILINKNLLDFDQGAFRSFYDDLRKILGQSPQLTVKSNEDGKTVLHMPIPKELAEN